MIEGNIIKFGYSDLAIKAMYNSIEIIQYKSPEKIKCGDCLQNKQIEFTGDKILIKLKFNECLEFKKQLTLIEIKKIKSFRVKGYILDFTNYNKESIEVCKRALREIVWNTMYPLAC